VIEEIDDALAEPTPEGHLLYVDIVNERPLDTGG
jgi:hypothetical protein